MFDRFSVVEATSPVGARGVALATAVHAVVLGIGLHTAHQSEKPHPLAVSTIFVAPASEHHTRGVEPMPAPPVGPILGIPSMPRIDPGPIGEITRYSPGQLVSLAPGDSIEAPGTGVFDSSVVEQVPELLSAPPPRYPEMLRLAHFEGVVTVEGVVDTLGRFERGSLRVMSSPHPELSSSAIESMSGALFRPGRVYGRGVRVLVQISVRFAIQRR